MTLFVVLAAAMVLLALAVVVVPLLRHVPARGANGDPALVVLADAADELQAQRVSGALSDAEYTRALRELQQQALQSHAALSRSGGVGSSPRANWGAALATAVALPLVAVALYLSVGQPSVINGNRPLAGSPHLPGDDAITALSQRLARDGNDAEGWVLLARSSFQARRIDEALNAYRKATALQRNNADLWVEYANTLAIANDRKLSGEPTRLVERALEIDPDNLNALAFAGLAALQGGNRGLALRHWQRLQSLVPDGSEDRERIAALIARAQGEPRPASATVPAQAAERPVETGAASTPSIRGTVSLDAALASQVAPTDTLFVFARATDGPPMPLAAMRTRTAGWPVAFTLDDSSAMGQGRALSQSGRVQIVARISRLGSPGAQPGDIEGTMEGVAVGASDVRVVLNRVVGR
ncbi:MAG: c-type cytochrome biogenesis protein CcmI [Comamonas sp.]|nr:c-type cytochrome biogenesis protein CcmI [Comamonas sp.]